MLQTPEWPASPRLPGLVPFLFHFLGIPHTPERSSRLGGHFNPVTTRSSLERGGWLQALELVHTDLIPISRPAGAPHGPALTMEAMSIGSWGTPECVNEDLVRVTSSNKGGGGSLSSHRTKEAVDFTLPQRDQLSSTTLRTGQARQVLKSYEKMRQRGIKESSYTFVAALKACSSLQDLQGVKRIHGEVLKSEFESHVYVCTVLVDVYAKCGSLVDARLVFEKMPHRNVVSWNAIILGYAQMEEGDEALRLYFRMQQDGVVRDDRTFVGALKACSSLAAVEERNRIDGTFVKKLCLEQVRAIHSDVVKSGFESDIYVGSMLVDVYAKCGSLVDARRVFEMMPRRNVVSWTAIILGYAQMDEGEVALQLYKRMQQECVTPNDRTFVSALKACSSMAVSEGANKGTQKCTKMKTLDQVRAIHLEVVKSGSESALFVGTMLVDVYAKCGSLVDARLVFDKMPHRSVVSWTAMILGYAQMKQGEEALHLYTQMRREGVQPEVRTIVSALKACSSVATSDEGNSTHEKRWCLQQVRAIHSDAVKNGSESDLFVGNMLVDVYAKCGSLVDARRVFETMSVHNVVSWTSMILGYVQAEEGEVALQLYLQMQQEGVLPDALAFVGALKACGSMAGLQKGKTIHRDIAKAGLQNSHPCVASSLVDMYAKCGSMVDAQQVFDALPTVDIVTWNALLAGYARQGETEPVFDLLEQMKQGDTQPDSITFLSVLTVCSHVGSLDKGQNYFEEMMRDFGITPVVEHYTCMVDLLGRAGHLDKAMAMANSMPCQTDGALWQTVLGACRKWGDVEIGRQAFENARRLDKNHAAAYVMMSNMYARANMWDEAKGIEAMRLKTRAWKQPGQTRLTDLGGVVHAFVVADLEPANIQEISSELQDLFVRMKEEGFGLPNHKGCCSIRKCEFPDEGL